ncbi:16S rRNA (uracil(1498)-N(3))-methyltransferase [Buchnera aphidicola]|uniref:16S rRNA (uracil(1498)-N(3))-methyltransferase n=1 Tax=Buchnera aphidicola TaxID=9 RepID=UPI003AF09FE7
MFLRTVKENKNMKKNIPRLYIKENLKIKQIFYLSRYDTYYIQKVLRMKVEDVLEIFNNTNYIFFSKIIYLSDKIIKIKIFDCKFKNNESPLHIHLGQVISSNEKMDFTIQKSVEMGVNIITPLISEYCNVKKKGIDFSKKIKRWEKIVVASCQQCRRNIIPIIQYPQDIFSWCQNNTKNSTKIIFHTESKSTINHLPQYTNNVHMIVGSEGGFSNNEIFKITEYGFFSIKLGPRILRTETATVVAITALQIKFGDFLI